MKRLLTILLLLTMLFNISTAGAAVLLPAQLTEIEEEAFYGSDALAGLVEIPAGVSVIGADAFSNTALFALCLPEGVSRLGAQTLPQAAYVRLNGSNTQLAGLSGVRYLIAPAGSQGESYAQQAGLDFVATSAVETSGQFLYREDENGLTLLSAVDASLVEEEVTIPAAIDGKAVNGITAYAFLGCGSIRSLRLPAVLKDDAAQTLAAHCPDASVEYYGETTDDPLTVESVTSSVEAGPAGEEIVWQVTASSGSGIDEFAYTLMRDGECIDTAVSSQARYSYTASEAGSYQLLVTVRDGQGATAQAASSVLYIAVESMVMTVPATHATGRDLKIEVAEVEGVERYLVFLTREETGEIVDNHTLYEAGSITFYGMDLEAGEYRVTGYVIGNDFRYSVPTVKRVTVSGERTAAPEIPVFDPMAYPKWDELFVELPQGEYLVRKWFRYSDGTESEPIEMWREDGFWVYFDEPEKWTEGGSVMIQLRSYADGAWSQWSETGEIRIQSAPTVENPVLNASATHTAGMDYTVSFNSVENASGYRLILCNDSIVDGDYWYPTGYFYESPVTPDNPITIPGYEIDEETFYVMLQTTPVDGFRAPELPAVVEVHTTGTRPAAPVVTADKTELYLTNDPVTLTINAPGAEGVRVIYRSYRPLYDSWYSWETTLYPDGNDTVTDRYTPPLSDEYAGGVCRCEAYACVNGAWSKAGVVELPLKQREPLAEPVMTVPETVMAGQDLAFSFAAVENADYYGAGVYRSLGDTNIRYWGSHETFPDQPLVLSGCRLAPGSYYVRVNAYSAEFGSSVAQKAFTVTGTLPAAVEVTADCTEVRPQEPVTFQIDTAGVEGLLCRRMYDDTYGSQTDYYDINVLEDVTCWQDYSYNTRVYHYSFSAYKDGLWTAWSPTIDVTVVEQASLQPPVLTLPSGLSAGEDLTVSVGAVPDATDYTVNLNNSQGVWVASRTLDAAGDVTFEGYLLQQGTYTVRATAYGNGTSSDASRYTLTVSAGERPQAPACTAETEVGRVNVSYGFVVDTQDAERVAVRYYRDGNTNDLTYRTMAPAGDTTRWTDANGTVGQVWVYAFAVKKAGVWSPWSSAHKVTITNREQLANVTISCPSSVQAGEDLYVSFTGVENADSYTMTLTAPDGSYTRWTAYPDGEKRLPGYDLVPGSYRVEVRATGAGYSESVAQTTVQVTGQRGDAPQVTVDKTQLFEDEDITFVILTNGGEEVAYRAVYTSGGSSSGTLKALSDPVVWETSIYSSGTRSYTFATLRGGKWSAWSEPVEITVDSRPELPEAEVSMPQTLRQGCDLEVQVGAVEGATRYEVRLYSNRGEFIDYQYLTIAGSALFPGYQLPTGAVRVEVDAYGANGARSETTGFVTVQAASLPDAPTVTPPEDTAVSPQDSFTFRIATQGASRGAVRYYRVGSPNDIYYREFTVNGDSTTWRDSWYNADNTYAYSFAVLTGGVWSDWSAPVEITIEATAVIPEPVVSLPESVDAGQDLVITIDDVQGASYYYVTVYDAAGRQLAYRQRGADGTVTIPGYQLTAGNLRVQVEASGSGTSSETNCSLTVNSAVQPDAPQVTPNESITVEEDGAYAFTLATAGADAAVVRYYRIGDSSVNYREIQPDSGESTVWQGIHSYSSGSIYAYSFAIRVNGVWSGWSTYTEVTIQ